MTRPWAGFHKEQAAVRAGQADRCVMKDYYAVMLLERDATIGEIKQAYRRLAKEHHPDRNQGDEESEERLKAINEAYHVLGDEGRRRQYDFLTARAAEAGPYLNRDPGEAFMNNLWAFYRAAGPIGRGMGGCGGRGFGGRGCGRGWRRRNDGDG